MNKKIIAYIIIGIIILLLLFSSFGMIKFNKTASNNNENMPEECRKPEGQSLEAWKEHLGHHQNTLYCLDYYK